MSGHGEEAIKKSVRTYMVVFVSLAALTVLTVAVSYLDLPTAMGILVARTRSQRPTMVATGLRSHRLCKPAEAARRHLVGGPFFFVCQRHDPQRHD